MKRSISLKKLWIWYNEWENCMTPATRSIYHDYFPYFVEAKIKKLTGGINNDRARKNNYKRNK